MTQRPVRPLTSTDARRAVYVDFECLKGRPPHPALLGVLIGADGADGPDDKELEQIITDPRLAPARVAKKARLRVVAAADAGAELVAMALADGRKIVGWSYFDRDRLIEACPGLEGEIRTIYVNALELARPWRRTIHPEVRIERADPHSPKHTLDKYARLVGYPGAHHLFDATPAKWIRHTLTQLEATGGNYRRTTSQTKRDWHKLLEYNRHDLLSLRHITITAVRELEAWRAYLRTRFCVDDSGRRICFMVGSINRALQALLKRHGTRQWAFLTAWNPGSIELSQVENDLRQRELIALVESAGYAWLPAEGVGQDPGWPPEQSLFVLGISRAEARQLGARFDQLAVVVGRRGAPSRLVHPER